MSQAHPLPMCGLAVSRRFPCRGSVSALLLFLLLFHASAVDVPAPRVVRAYALTSANDFPERDPADWRLLGSNDGGKTWTSLDHRKSETFSERHQRRVFRVPSPNAFSSYRLQIERVRNPALADSVQLAEIEPLGQSESDLDPVPTFEDVVTVRGDNSPLEARLHAFDGRVETKWLDYATTNASTRASWIQWSYLSNPERVITNTAQLRALRTRAAKPYPVRFEAVYAGALPNGQLCFMDGHGHVEVNIPLDGPLALGQRAVLKGHTRLDASRPGIGSCILEKLGPPPTGQLNLIQPDQLFSLAQELSPGRIAGRVRFSARRDDALSLEIDHDGVPMLACVLHSGAALTSNWVGTVVSLQGLCETVLDNRGNRVLGTLWTVAPPTIQTQEATAREPQGVLTQPRSEVLTKVTEIRELAADDLARWPKVHIEGVITELFGSCIQDATAGIEVWFNNDQRENIPAFGSRVSIEGRGDWAVGHGPIIRADVVRHLGPGKLPPAQHCSWSELATGRMVHQWVEVDAVVRATDGSHLLLSGQGGQLMATIRSAASADVKRLVDARICARGVTMAASDSRGRMQGVQLLIPSLDYIDVRQSAPDPFSLPVRPIGSLLQLRGLNELTHRVKIAGVVTYREGENYFIQDPTGGVMAIAQQKVVLTSRAGDWNWMFSNDPDTGGAASEGPGFLVGEQVEVVGFPQMGAYSPVLTEVLVAKPVAGPPSNSMAAQLPKAVAAKIADIMAGGLDATRVTIEAEVLRQQRLEQYTILELQCEDRVFQARFPLNQVAGRSLHAASKTQTEGNDSRDAERRSAGRTDLQPPTPAQATGSPHLPEIPPGSRVRVTGVCQLEPLPYAGLGQSVGAFKLLIGSPADLTILERPPWWTLRRALFAAGGLLIVLALAAGWIGILRRQVDERTRALHLEIAEHEKTEAQLAAETRRVQAEIEERKRIEAEVEKTHKQLLLTSRMAGMAEVATGVLHNVGNVLNSANVLASNIVDQLQRSKVTSVAKLADLLQRQQTGGVTRADHADPAPPSLPGYVSRLGEHLEQERTRLLDRSRSLTESIQHIKEIVATQQNYARISGSCETVPISEIVEDALRMHTGALSRHQVRVVREFEQTAPITLERHKLLQILFNLLENAKYACEHPSPGEKQITIRIRDLQDQVQVLVIDNGMGIPKENLARIFAQDFSTRKHGHGLGLHSSLLVAQEMGGSLIARSDGPGCGATFVLEIPKVLVSETGGQREGKRAVPSQPVNPEPTRPLR